MQPEKVLPLSAHCSASLTTWTIQLSTLERRAAEHERYSSELVLQVSDPLRNIAIKYEELRKSHADFATKLEKEKEAALGIQYLRSMTTATANQHYRGAQEEQGSV